jgi:hypothetical protein
MARRRGIFSWSRWLAVSVILAGSWWGVRAQQQNKAPAEIGPDHAAKMAKGLEVFKKHVRPLLVEKCLRCHGGKEVESEFDLSDREGLLKGGLYGPAVVAGKVKESLLYKLITHTKDPHMPHNAAKLPPEAIQHIANWIELGAPYDGPLKEGKAKKTSWTDKVLPAQAKQFWSFEPLHRVEPPKVKRQDWCKTPLDRFILAKLEGAGIAPNESASKHQLIRRVYFDLIGLPPGPEEVQAFVNDSAPDAYARLVDRLLNSPHYGERWARHWLDLARFAESHGFEHDYDRPTAFHYRDFVIEALNQDLPYHTFVKWQIAGDEYAPDNPLAMKATGYLAAGVHSTQITKSEVEKHRYDEMDDKLATIGTSLLGLTIGCARCHDHKYDPIPQRDYYRMLATFTSTVRSEMDLDLDPESYRLAKKVFDIEHAPFQEAMKKYETEVLPGKLHDWEKTSPALGDYWEIVEVKEAKSKAEATLTLQDDGSLVASGTNAKFDTYTIVAHCNTPQIQAVRLEALADLGFAKAGPGRAANGNFALSDFKVTVAPLRESSAPGEKEKKSKPIPVKLKNPRATFEQKGLPVAATIDGDAKSAWAIDPQFGKVQAAVYQVEGPVGFAGGSVLTFTLQFNNNDGHNLGKLRLAVFGKAPAALTGPGMPGKVKELLTQPTRNEKQLQTILHWYRTQDVGWLALNQKRLEHLAQAPKPKVVKALIATEGIKAVRLHTQGEDLLPETHFLRRGDPENKEGVASQSFLQVLMPTPDSEKRWQTEPPAGWRTSYRRRALAEWLTDVDQGAGHLLARVIVNRLWQHHIGRGIVATASDFGNRGEKPTHPELLDYLASELIKNGWRLKPLHKLIVTSAVYMQGTQFDEARAKVDRDNKWCWRHPTRRLEAEVIRDNLLAVSGMLDPTMHGPGTLDPASKRRSIYFTIKRSKLVPMMVIFDAPEALSSMAERPTTTIAPQALHLLNNPQVRSYARSLALRIAPNEKTTLEEAVQAGYLRTLARLPNRDELADGVAFVQQQMETYSGTGRRESALTDFCQVLVCLNEFVYVD